MEYTFIKPKFSFIRTDIQSIEFNQRKVFGIETKLP